MATKRMYKRRGRPRTRVTVQPKKSQPLRSLPDKIYDAKSDKRYKALHGGKRITSHGTVYYERRKNRADKDRKKKY